jgi:hypothetical protein
MLIYLSGKPFFLYIVLYIVSKETKVIYSLERQKYLHRLVNFGILIWHTKSFIEFYLPICINISSKKN